MQSLSGTRPAPPVIDRRIEVLHDRFLGYNRKVFSMLGPQTDELIQAGKILTPYPRSFSTARFPLVPRDEKFMAVLVPTLEVIALEGLSRPTAEQTIRFVSQLEGRDIHVDNILVFATDPPFSGDVLPGSDWWPTLTWNAEKNWSDLRLFSAGEREEKWPERTFFVAIATI